jgi:protein-L-isoaspartate O-methyltransferase
MENFRLRSFGHVIQDQWGSSPVFITDAKRKDPPSTAGEKHASKSDLPIEHDLPTLEAQAERREAAREGRVEKAAEAAPFMQIKESLRTGGVKVIAAPQLFPTPAALARRVIELSDIQPGMTVLEPSAATGALIRAIPVGAQVVAVELVANLARALEYMVPDVRCGDFLGMNGELGTFDRVVMNPPFSHGADIEHIEHARAKLKPGGRLVAVCANGPRQREQFERIATEWIDLPVGSFKEQGTNVNAAIVVIDAIATRR